MSDGGRDAYPSLGSRASWHLVAEAPLGAPDEAAATLMAMVQKYGDRPAQNWPIQPQIIKGMAVELAVLAGIEGRAFSGDLIHLLAWAAGLNSDFVQDTPAFFGGSWKGGRPRGDDSALTLASGLDRRHYQTTGKMMPLAVLQGELREHLGELQAPSRSTLKRWRNDPDYQFFVQVAERAKT